MGRVIAKLIHTVYICAKLSFATKGKVQQRETLHLQSPTPLSFESNTETNRYHVVNSQEAYIYIFKRPTNQKLIPSPNVSTPLHSFLSPWNILRISSFFSFFDFLCSTGGTFMVPIFAVKGGQRVRWSQDGMNALFECDSIPKTRSQSVNRLA